jgi:hypothetical protein
MLGPGLLALGVRIPALKCDRTRLLPLLFRLPPLNAKHGRLPLVQRSNMSAADKAPTSTGVSQTLDFSLVKLVYLKVTLPPCT